MESIGEMLLGFRRGSETREREEELKKTAHASPVTAVLDWTIGYKVNDNATHTTIQTQQLIQHLIYM